MHKVVRCLIIKKIEYLREKNSIIQLIESICIHKLYTWTRKDIYSKKCLNAIKYVKCEKFKLVQFQLYNNIYNIA